MVFSSEKVNNVVVVAIVLFLTTGDKTVT